MRLLLIEAIDPSRKMGISFFSFGLGYIASYLKKHIQSVDIKIINRDIVERLHSFKPDIVGISSVTQNYNIAKEIARICKNESYPVIVGGCHITALPNSLDSSMDIAVIGEGEDTMLEILQAVEKYGFDKERLKDIFGIAYREPDGTLAQTSNRRHILPMDDIPYPDRELLGITNKSAMITSRGCPYRCIFCSSSRMWPNVRYFSAEYVVGEIKLLYEKYKSRYIELWDDLFIANKPRLRDIINLLKEEGLLGKIEFCFAVRANLVNEEVGHLLNEMNVVMATMGLESMSQPVLDYLKSNVMVEQNERAVKILNRSGIKASASFIIGSPKETEADILKTFDFVKARHLCRATAYLLTPLPGTPVWEYAKSKGLVCDDMDWNRLNVDFTGDLKKSVILSEHLSRERLCYYLKLFQKESKRKEALFSIKRFYRRIIGVLSNPYKIIWYINNLRCRLLQRG